MVKTYDTIIDNQAGSIDHPISHSAAAVLLPAYHIVDTTQSPRNIDKGKARIDWSGITKINGMWIFTVALWNKSIVKCALKMAPKVKTQPFFCPFRSTNHLRQGEAWFPEKLPKSEGILENEGKVSICNFQVGIDGRNRRRLCTKRRLEKKSRSN